MGVASVASRALLTKELSAERWALRRELKLSKRPVETLSHFGQAVCGGLARVRVPSPSAPQVLSVALVLALVAALRIAEAWPRSAVRADVVSGRASYALWWVFCGILSTVGLGTGVQTGALFLFPHVAKVAADWGRGTDVEWMWDERWFSSSERPSPLALEAAEARPLLGLLSRAALPGVFSGAGSAVGELVPFLIARAMVRAGADPFALLTDDGDPVESTSATRRRWTPAIAVARTRSALESQLATRPFWKIFLLGLIPNPIFDLCALVCGSLGVSFKTFFSAVLLAKAVVRTPLQTCAVAVSVLKLPEASALAPVRRLRGTVAAKFRADVGTVAPAARRTKLLIVTHGWALVTSLLFLGFLISTVEQVAQQRAVALLQASWDSRPVVHQAMDNGGIPAASR